MDSKSFNIGRRRFLQTSGVALATAAMAPRVIASELAMHPKRLSIGYAPLDGDGRIGSAASILSTDGAFISNGARVTVLGNSGTSTAARRGVELVAHYGFDADNGTRGVVPFTAWGCSRKNGCSGKAVSFNVPVDVDQRVLFSVTVQESPYADRGFLNRIASTPDETATTPASLPVELSLRNAGGSLKLARGFYFIAPLFEGDSEPSWASCELKNIEGTWTLIERGLFDAKPAAFEHFIVRIDYAAQ